MSAPTPSAAAQPLTLEQAFDKALALHQQGNLPAAEKLYQAILKQCPQQADCLHLLGVIQFQYRRLEAALALINQALAINPQLAAAYANKGLVLHRLLRLNEAIDSYSTAIQLNPQSAEAFYNRGNAYKDTQRFSQASADYQRLLELNPHAEYVLGTLMYCQASRCDWHYRARLTQLQHLIHTGAKASLPFTLLTLVDDPALQLRGAQIYAADKFPPQKPLWHGEKYQHDRIRVAYLSADFHDHATTYLMAELFERHNNQHFEIHAFSFGVNQHGGIRQRLQRNSHFHDVVAATDLDIAQLLRQHEIDIAIDLKGFTQHSRTAIFSHRGAPIQVNYLGYPGTMGTPYIDYLIADSHIIPPEDDVHYQEKVVRLPDSYQVNDSKRTIADYTPTRRELGLPDNAFVFCCFNNHYKITAEVFAVWMRLLQRVPDSVLWLLGSNPEAQAHLQQAAQRQGIAPERLIFAPRMALPEHLARHRQADLFLDNVPVNAHTGSSDALWAGLPVLTLSGKAFAGRVAGSLLKAIGLPELIAQDLADYERLALLLATDRTRLSTVKAKLAHQRQHAPLFDTVRFCRHLESAYEKMYARYQQGLNPESMTIEAID